MTLVSRTVLAVWGLLMGITLISWWLGGGHGMDPKVASSAILVLSFVKARFVAVHFMDAGTAPTGLRIGIEALLACSCAALVGLVVWR
ncbi:MAG: cytochrome C oxidase subunit IV family protein [Solirubrobacteraceae bacterium]